MAVRNKKKRKASESRAPQTGGTTLRDQNLAAFRKYAPALFKLLAPHQPQSQLVHTGRDELNILQSTGPLFGGFGARSYTDRRCAGIGREQTGLKPIL